MITVLVAADELDEDFWYELTNLIDRNFPTMHLYQKKLLQKSPDPALFICDTQSFSQVHLEQVIVIHKSVQPPVPGLTGARHAIAVVDSRKERLLDHVAGTGIAAITCGLRSRDTITLSSISEDSAVINIQRSIMCIDKSEVEPQEIPVKNESHTDSFALMAAASVCILSGNIGVLLNGKI